MSTVNEALQQLDLGNSVAEFDEALEKYFVETHTMRLLVEDRVDLVAGDKGTGKTALYRILHKRYAAMPELADVEIIPGFNPAGNPIFQRLTEGDVLEEGQYITIWKAYILALVGNWILQLYEYELTAPMRDLEDLLDKTGLRSADDSPSTVFSLLINLFRRLANPKSIEVTMSVSPQGLPIVVPRVEFEAADGPSEAGQLVRHDEALKLLNSALESVGLHIWVVLDRLDEAFQGFPAAEVPALRALLRTYLDLQDFSQLRLKLCAERPLPKDHRRRVR